jgi:superfamily II DNA or RNA helicase
MSYAVGTLVRARGREWVVLPESDGEMLILRPLGGTDDEVAGIYLPLETVEPAQFGLPDPSQPGDFRSCRLLRDAVRLGFRSSAGPFRSFGKIAVEPRPYQLVPLLVALRLDPVRLLIADDVGIGKTVEAALVARELLDRGEAGRLAVLCPPHLAEQWQTELAQKFHIEAALVLPSTASRLESRCGVGESLFALYDHVIVSLDFIKSDRRREEFLRNCPPLVIVDEAHTCAAGEGRKQQRHALLKKLAQDISRHLILVTATPHSGKEEAFRSLLALLKPEFANLPEDLSGKANEHHRRELAAHLIQRRRPDIEHYLNEDTPFPTRQEEERTYRLSPEYYRFFERVFRYAREVLVAGDEGRHRRRIRYWSMLALLRCLVSSPAAAATLRARAAVVDTQTPEEADEIGRLTVLDFDEAVEGADLAPGSTAGEPDDSASEEQKHRRRLAELAREAEALLGAKDLKLQEGTQLVRSLVEAGFNPIVFCRFIPTAEYVAAALRADLSKSVEVAAVTGTLPPAEREERVVQLGASPRRVLVCTDCLSEGINLQEYFDAVLHYDLSWNPTRHEQREGRVDRYGQPSRAVQVITYYGIDNPIDGLILKVLLRKHKLIRRSLGISVPVPMDSEQVVEAIFEGLLLWEKGTQTVQQLSLLEEFWQPEREDLHRLWDRTVEREKRSRTMFAQESLKVEEVACELEVVRCAIGAGVAVEAFVKEALTALGASVSTVGAALECDLAEAPQGLRDLLDTEKFAARFALPVQKGQQYFSRTHPVVEGLAGYVMDCALDPHQQAVARRCGVVRTGQVQRRTTVLLLRLRFHILTKRGETELPLLAEDCLLTAFEGSAQNARWLGANEAEKLLAAVPEANIALSVATEALQKVINESAALGPHLEALVMERGKALLEAHKRVRAAARLKHVSYRVEPQLPPDILGLYLYLPQMRI